MIKQIDALIEQLESVCDEFDYITDAESNWRVASRLSRQGGVLNVNGVYNNHDVHFDDIGGMGYRNLRNSSCP